MPKKEYRRRKARPAAQSQGDAATFILLVIGIAWLLGYVRIDWLGNGRPAQPADDLAAVQRALAESEKALAALRLAIASEQSDLESLVTQRSRAQVELDQLEAARASLAGELARVREIVDRDKLHPVLEWIVLIAQAAFVGLIVKLAIRPIRRLCRWLRRQQRPRAN